MVHAAPQVVDYQGTVGPVPDYQYRRDRDANDSLTSHRDLAVSQMWAKSVDRCVILFTVLFTSRSWGCGVFSVEFLRNFAIQRPVKTKKA